MRSASIAFLQRNGGLYYAQGSVKFIYSEKATKFCEISTLLLNTVHIVKSEVEILQNFVAFSEYMNFKKHEKGATNKISWKARQQK